MTAAAIPEHYARRMSRLRQVMQRANFDGFLITNAVDIRYLCPFTGEDSYALVTPGAFHIISDGRFAEELVPLSRWAQIIMHTAGIAPRTGEITSDLKLRRVALQAEHLTIQMRSALGKSIGEGIVHETTGILSELRVIKDDVEVRLIRQAVKVQQEALQATLKSIRPGVRESEIAARLEYEMRLRGAEGPAFSTNVSARDNGAKPHYRPSHKVKVAAGKPLLIDWGARVDGYCSDMTRTFGVGKFSREMREIYRVVLEAQIAAIAAIRPGVKCKDVDKVARDIIMRSPHGPTYTHGLGHGIGLNVHELPRLSSRAADSEVLETGMIVTVEPGIYVSGLGGVRIEDDILVTDTGHKVLSNWPKDLESAIL